MIVIIPTFKRIDCLKWTLISLFQAECPKDNRNCICLVNNDPNGKGKIEKIVGEFRAKYEQISSWEWIIIHREKTLDPIDNWYGAIKSTAEENEVVFLHGDDDLFMPWGIIERYHAITSKKADMLLSNTAHGLIYVNEHQMYWKGEISNRDPRPKLISIDWGEIVNKGDDWGPAFIGNHCYRYSKAFQQALEVCFGWCHKQVWLNWNTRTLMLPYYLPYAVKHVNGNLFGLKQVCVIRGTSINETLNAPFGIPGWNPGFLCLCAYGVFLSAPLKNNKELNNAREELSFMAAEWFFTFLFDKRINTKMALKTICKIILPINIKIALKIIRSLKAVIKEKLKRHFLLDKSNPKQLIETIDFLTLLNSKR